MDRVENEFQTLPTNDQLKGTEAMKTDNTSQLRIPRKWEKDEINQQLNNMRCAAKESRLCIPRKWQKENILNRPPIVEQPFIPSEKKEDEENTTSTHRVTYKAKGVTETSFGLSGEQISEKTNEQWEKEIEQPQIDKTSQRLVLCQAVIRLIEMSEDPDLLKNSSFALIINTLFGK